MAKKQSPVPARASLADTLFPKVRQRVLAVLFDAPQRSFYMGEVIALAHSGTGAVQRELADLAAAGLLTVHKQGHQKHYQANPDSPIFGELSALVGKTMGVVNVLRTALAPLAGQLGAAFVYDDVPPGGPSNPGAVTLVFFGDGQQEVAAALSAAMQGAANTLARQVSFTLYTPETLADAVAQDAGFLQQMMQAPKTWLIGGQEQLFNQPS